MAFDGSGLFTDRRWEYALKGELDRYTAEIDQAVMQAGRDALETVINELKGRLRDHVVRAGLAKAGAGSGKGSGRSLASAIRVEQYPKRGLARNPAALLYIQPSALKIYEAFEDGATITSSSGRFLTIPVPGSPASREQFGDKPRGASVLAKLQQRGIEIAFVPARAGKPAMLMAKNVRTTAGGKLVPIKKRKPGQGEQPYRRRTKKAFSYAQGATSVPLFFLIPKVSVPKKLSLRVEFERAANEFFTLFARELEIELQRAATARAA